MAQTFHSVSKRSPADLAHKQLEVEKVGVIAGFLIGLPLAIGPVSDILNSFGASGFVTGLGMAVTMAVTTRVGLLVGVFNPGQDRGEAVLCLSRVLPG